MNPIWRPSTWFAAFFAFVVAAVVVWLALMFFAPGIDSEVINLAAVIAGMIHATYIVRRII